jgi:hypothetical protein
VAQLEEVIQQLQQRIVDLELHTVPETPQEVRDLREAISRSTVDKLKTLAFECKQLSARSAQNYEKITENPELHTLEAQLQEENQHADVLQVQLKSVIPVEIIKRFAEQRTAQQQVHMLQSKVMEVSKQLQPLQEKECQLFTKLESQEAKLE